MPKEASEDEFDFDPPPKRAKSDSLPLDFVCEPCNKSFARLSEFRQHLGRETHLLQAKVVGASPDPSLPPPFIFAKVACEECGKMVSKDALRRHRKLHAAPEFVCQSCDQGFCLSRDLNKHLGSSKHRKRLAHMALSVSKEKEDANEEEEDSEATQTEDDDDDDKEDKVETPVHGLTAKQKIALPNHGKTACEVCGQWCVNNALAKHRAIHFPPQLRCDACDKMFATTEGLNQHLKTKTHQLTANLPPSDEAESDGGEPLPEYQPGMTALQIRALPGVVKVPCDVCSKMVSKCHLAEHHKSHLPKAYACQACDESFALSHHLKRHLKTNKHLIQSSTQTKLPPPLPRNALVACGECGRTVTKGEMARHVKLHSNGGFACQACDKSFSRDHSLQRHLQTSLHALKQQAGFKH